MTFHTSIYLPLQGNFTTCFYVELMFASWDSFRTRKIPSSLLNREALKLTAEKLDAHIHSFISFTFRLSKRNEILSDLFFYYCEKIETSKGADGVAFGEKCRSVYATRWPAAKWHLRKFKCDIFRSFYKQINVYYLFPTHIYGFSYFNFCFKINSSVEVNKLMHNSTVCVTNRTRNTRF